MKYRIVKTMFCGKPRFHIEKKSFLGWSSIDELQICNDGVSWNDTMYFSKYSDAESYIFDKENSREVVKVFSFNCEEIDIFELLIVGSVAIFIICYGLAFLLAVLSEL